MKETSENRKALPKFFGMIVVAGLIGGVVGMATVAAESFVRNREMQDLAAMVGDAALIALPVCILVLLGIGLHFYRAARRAFQSWDGEEETVMEQAEEHLNWALLLDSISMILAFLFFSVGTLELLRGGLVRVLFVLAFFVVAIVLEILLQQRVVDLTREMNPEKHGSVYDKNFRKVWWESCDENERRQIGQASYKAYTTMTVFCPALWGVLFFGNMIFDFGILPSAVVLLIWAAGQVSYTLESIRLNRH